MLPLARLVAALLAGSMLCAGLAPGSAAASDAFVDRTYFVPVPLLLRGAPKVAHGGGLLPYTMDARIAPPIVMTSSLQPWGQRDGFSHAYVFTPRVDLRQTVEHSLPVPTPALWPTLQFRHSWEYGPPTLRRRFLLELLFAHISNGQKGCFFAGQVAEGTRCVWPDGVARERGPLNHVDGSYSRNELGLRFAYTQGLGPNRLQVGVGTVSYVPYAGGLEPIEREITGRGRNELRLAWHRDLTLPRLGPGRVSLRAEAVQRWNTGPQVGAMTGDVMLSYSLRALHHWGPWVRWVAGADPYNIRQDVQIHMLAFGFVWDLRIVDADVLRRP